MPDGTICAAACRAWLGAMFLVALLGGCATPHGARAPVGHAMDGYSLEARFGLRENGNSHSGKLHWRHSPDRDQVLVLDPFGSGVAELQALETGARMRLADGRLAEAPDARDLMHELTGIALPVRELARWMTGRGFSPMPDDARDEFGRLLRIQRQGWRLDYRYDDDAADALPSRVNAVDGQGIELRLAIEQWGHEPPEPTK